MRVALHSRGSRVFLLASAALAMSAATADGARAATFCVGNPACASGPANNHATVASALAATAAAPGTDRVEISSGTYVEGPLATGATNVVEIVGVGATKPVITATASPSATVLSVDAPGSSVENVAFLVPGAADPTGLRLTKQAAVTNVSVTADPAAVNAVGILATGHNSSVLSGLDVNLAWGAGNSPTAVGLQAAGSAKIYASTLRAAIGIRVENSNNVDLQRLRVTADNGVLFLDSSGTVSSSLLKWSAPATMSYHYGLRVNNLSGATKTVYATNNTLVDDVGGPTTGIVSTVDTPGFNDVFVNSNVIHGFDASFLTDGTGSHNIVTVYSRYDVTPPQPVGVGSALYSGDPGFTDAPSGDFTLRRDSALVDAGDPGAVPTGGQPIPSARDLNGADRVINAVGTDAPVRDIGAYEVQNASPVAVINVLTPTPQTATPVSFSSAGSGDPDGDAVSVRWSFDDGTTADGPSAQKVFNVVGIQTVTLTITDATGLSATTAAQVQVTLGTLSVSLPRGTAKADANGRFKYRFACPAAATVACSGRVVFVTAKKVDPKRYARSARTSRKRRIWVAILYYKIAPGAARTHRVKTYPTFKSMLKRDRRVVLEARLTGSAENAKLTAGRTRLTVKATRR